MRISDCSSDVCSSDLEQISSPLSVYRKPRTRFVAGFIGAPSMNFIAVGADAGSHHPEDGAWSAGKDITRSISRDRERREYGTSGYVGVDSGGSRIIKKQSRSNKKITLST